ncbi:MAG TPA: hypothetical protein VL357_01475 [Rariglobus sp.]|jgi:hypothetical protein|nr:hypothetical protein [Rariglobus sp.]
MFPLGPYSGTPAVKTPFAAASSGFVDAPAHARLHAHVHGAHTQAGVR